MVKKFGEGKERVNKIFNKLYCMTINDLADSL